jgi:hypothetical protein
MIKWWHNLRCWFDCHEWGNQWETEHEFYDELHQMVGFTECKHCGIWKRIY